MTEEQQYEELLADALNKDSLEALALSHEIWSHNASNPFTAICFYQFTQLLMDEAAFNHLLEGDDLTPARDYLIDNPHDDAGAHFENRILFRIFDTNPEVI